MFISPRLAHPDISASAKTSVLQLFPTKCGAHPATAVETVLRLTAGTPRTSKELGTARTRRIHYLRFCYDLKLTDDLHLANISQARRNWQMALHAVHMAAGNYLFCRSIKASTILAYLRDVARFLGRFSDIDARFRASADTTLAPCIKAVLDEVIRWETVPDRHEPFTVEMWKCLASLGPESQPDGIIDAITCWSGCGLCRGFRNTEWAQDNSHADVDHPQADTHGDAKAFRLDDILWQTPTKVRLPLSSVLADESAVGRAALRFKA
jgi:hypothetical protein